MSRLRIILDVETDLPISALEKKKEWEFIISEYAWHGKTVKVRNVKVEKEVVEHANI